MKLLVATSTFPISDSDKVPAFVKEQVIAFKDQYPDTDITVLAPHNYYGRTVQELRKHNAYNEVRFHYFRPHRFELLAGRAIMPALKQNKLLYLQIPFFVFFQFWALLRQTQKTKPDLIYCHWFMPQAISAAIVSKITRTPFVFTTHASDVAVLYKIPFTRPLIRWVCKNAQAYTAVSQRTTDKLQRAFDPEDWQAHYRDKLSIIPMGVDTALNPQTKSQLAKTRKKYGLPDDKKLVVFVGRLAEKKGITYLIEAIKLLGADADDAHFVIAGDGQLMEELSEQAQGLDNVTFTGYVHGSDKDALLQLADGMCFPSIIDSMNDSEGFPVVIMESLAAGKVVMGSDVSGAETIFNHGTNGFVFKEKSAADLAQTLQTFLTLPNEKIKSIEKESLSLAKQYSWVKIARKHMEVLERSLKAKSNKT